MRLIDTPVVRRHKASGRHGWRTGRVQNAPAGMITTSAFLQRLGLSASMRRLTSRERLLVAGLALVGFIMVPLKSYEWQQTAMSEYANAQADLLAAREGVRRDPGQGALRQILAQRARLRSWSWAAPSRSVGRVLIENQVVKLALKAGILAPDVKAGDVLDMGEVELVPIELNARFDWITFSKFLASLDDAGKGVIIDSFSVSSDLTPSAKLKARFPIFVPGDHPSGGAKR